MSNRSTSEGSSDGGSAKTVPERIRATAPWLLDPALELCAVGSTALAEACRRDGLIGPRTHDLDLAWNLPVDRADALLEQHGAAIGTTDANRARGTLGLRLDTERIEITSFRGADLDADLARRDMTIGSLAWRLHDDRIFDPIGGLADWRNRRVVAVGDVATRVREHPVRWLRYYRKAHHFDFALDSSIRQLDLPVRETLEPVPAEAIGAELRAALTTLPSPGRLLQELHEAGLLQHIAPELAPQFDGRPAGPQRYHPEISQALHLVLALEWAFVRTCDLEPADAYAVRFATLCHDLGKGVTDPAEFPSHRGHEGTGRPLVTALCDRLPGLTDSPTRQLALEVCQLHLLARGIHDLRAGTLARLYEQHFRNASLRADLFALAVAADYAGRLGRTHEGDDVRAQVESDIGWIRERCGAVDAKSIREQHGTDIEAFRLALHEARARSLSHRRS